MSIYEQNKEFYSRPIRLSTEQKKDPLKVIDDFFIDFHLYESREHLATWLQCALITRNSQFAEAHQRGTIVTFAERLEELIEAAYLLRLKNVVRLPDDGRRNYFSFKTIVRNRPRTDC